MGFFLGFGVLSNIVPSAFHDTGTGQVLVVPHKSASRTQQKLGPRDVTLVCEATCGSWCSELAMNSNINSMMLSPTVTGIDAAWPGFLERFRGPLPLENENKLHSHVCISVHSTLVNANTTVVFMHSHGQTVPETAHSFGCVPLRYGFIFWVRARAAERISQDCGSVLPSSKAQTRPTGLRFSSMSNFVITEIFCSGPRVGHSAKMILTE